MLTLLRSLNSAAEAVNYTLNPFPKQLGQKYGNRFPEIRKQVLAMMLKKMPGELLSGKPIEVEAAGETYDFTPGRSGSENPG